MLRLSLFLGTDVLAFFVSLAHGLVTVKTGVLGGIFLVPLLLGVSLGNRFFRQSEADAFRRKVLILPMLLAVATLIRSVWG
ncbi:MAG: hypothetical protein HGJ94_06090 [Desulfosarcina sp.]|nr:hypothetical protein [Desulfosarcina sp.]MBC2745306.1 hypothetical protein [Desulfosarcina sp.]MBC2768211.1 hypothetical protein [Desulfosarcina sp.]